jgi:hypothetical protein
VNRWRYPLLTLFDPYTRIVLRRAIIVAFVLWHGASVAIYAMPTSENAWLRWFDAVVRPTVRPYMLATSQWQSWELFASDPHRRSVNLMLATKNSDGTWTVKGAVDPASVPWWRKSDELKTMRSLEESEANKPLFERYIELLCPEFGIPPGTEVRVMRAVVVIPYVLEWKPPSWWRSFPPEWQGYLESYVLCPPASA